MALSARMMAERRVAPTGLGLPGRLGGSEGFTVRAHPPNYRGEGLPSRPDAAFGD